MRKPSTHPWRTAAMALLATFIGSHFGMVAMSLGETGGRHIGKIEDIRAGTYTPADALSAIGQTALEGLAIGWFAFVLVAPTALWFGLISHNILLKTGRWRRWHYGLAGAIMGVPALGAFLPTLQSGSGMTAMTLWLGASTGAVSALVFHGLMGGVRAAPNTATWRPFMAKSNVPKPGIGRIILTSIGAAIVSGIAINILKALTFFVSAIPMLATGGLSALNQMDPSTAALGSDIYLQQAMVRFGISIVMCLVIHWMIKRSGSGNYFDYILAGIIFASMLIALQFLSGSFLFGDTLWRFNINNQIFWPVVHAAVMLGLFRRFIGDPVSTPAP